jgi:adenylate cyclase
LAEFQSAVDAVRCATEIQRGMADREPKVPEERRIRFRIGVNLGDIIKDGRDIYGDGVNVAARLEALAEPGGICISRVVRDQVRDKVDFGFEDLGEQQVKNIARPVHVYRIPLAETARTKAPLVLPDKPSLAVLPFQNMTGDPEQDYFVDGMVEEITTAISRLPWLFVIARNSSFIFKGRAVDVKQVARELGVQYVLEGSVRKAANRVRITGQLIDTTTAAHIWGDRFDGVLDDIFALQNQVASNVVGAIEPKLQQSEIQRANRKPTESLDAYDFYLRALAHSHKLTAESHGNAIRMLEQALAIDPSYSPAMALVGWCRLFQIVQGWLPLADAKSLEALQLAKQATEIGKDDPDTFWMAGHAVVHLGGEHLLGTAAVERALVLNPNCAHAWRLRGFLHCALNRPQLAIEALSHAVRLSPLDPLGFLFTYELAFAHMLAKRFDEAMALVDRSLAEQPRWVAVVRLKVALCGHLGRAEEGREWLVRLRELHPTLTIAELNAFRARAFAPEVRAVYTEGLRQAGLPEE